MLTPNALGAMLHWHANFGLVPMSDMCRTRVLVRHAQNPYLALAFYFIFFEIPTRLQHGVDLKDTVNQKKKKEKSGFRHLETHLPLILFD